ncbi:hypothetical protein NAL19_3268 [Pectobacterium sp. F1-1]|nr:hypothetical protein NAL19_3268 [Pectobacterium sp. F1-1]
MRAQEAHLRYRLVKQRKTIIARDIRKIAFIISATLYFIYCSFFITQQLNKVSITSR